MEIQNISQRFLKRIGKNIHDIRLEKELTMVQLGFEIGLNKAKVSRLEKGYNITMITLLKISLALGVSTSDLVKFDEKVTEEDLDWLVKNNRTSKLPKKKK
jgi:transcriptional regulator with XRE-family HTH domain